MKLKIGNTVLNQRAIKNLLWVFFFVGVYIGVSFALSEDGKGPVSLPLAIPLFLVVAKLTRGIREEIENERNMENDEAR